MRQTTIYCSKSVRALWPSRLPREWARLYPHLFDQHDVRITRRQPKNHFAEWFAAIHIFQRDGHLSLVEKYVFSTHPQKLVLLARILGQQRTRFDALRMRVGGQPPDLLIYTRDFRLAGFAEVKGPGDRIRPRQVEMHRAIERTFGVGVEIINVKLA